MRYSLEDLYYISQIISVFIIAGGFIFGFFQLHLYKKEASIIRSKERIQQALKLCNFYKDNILDKLDIIEAIYKESGIFAILEKIDKKAIVNFDTIEMNRLLTKESVESIKKITECEDFEKLLVQVESTHRVFDVIEKREVIITNKDNKHAGTKSVVSINRAALLRKYSGLINSTLNNLEYFSMYFNYELADNGVVYQSLHQTFIKAVELLYCDISANNSPENDKYFTNIIKLYRKWVDKQAHDSNEKLRHMRSIENGKEPVYTEYAKK